MTKPEKAQMVENHLCQMARSGQMMNKLTDDQLVSLLERLSEQTQKATKVTVRICFLLLSVRKKNFI